MVTGNLPAGPVAGTPRFHCRGLGFNPWSGNYDPTSLAGCDKDGADEDGGDGKDNDCEGDGGDGNMMMKMVIVTVLVMMMAVKLLMQTVVVVVRVFLFDKLMFGGFVLNLLHIFLFFWCKVTQLIIHVSTLINYL